MDPASERGQKLLEGTVERVDDLLAIVTDLLELAKIREGQKNAPWQPGVDIREMLLEIFDEVGPVGAKRSVRLHHDLRPAILAYGIPPDLRFALQNVVHNAVRYSRDSGDVKVTMEEADERAVITVVDRGIGIPEEIQRDVFLEFVRAPNAKHHAPQGTGLGLSIAKEAVEVHGGRMSLESQEGIGTTVTVELPLQTTLPDGAQLQREAWSPPAWRGRSRDG